MIADSSNAPKRIVTIGDESVGKTSLASRLVDNTFNPFEPSTVGANYQIYSTQVDDDTVNLQIWDTAGQEKFKSLSPIYFRNAVAAVCVFSLTNKQTFERLGDWISSFTEVAGASALIVIAANKSDLVDSYQVPLEAAKKWSEDQGYKFFTTSAKTGENVKEMYQCVAEELHKLQDNKQSTLKNLPKEKENSGTCC